MWSNSSLRAPFRIAEHLVRFAESPELRVVSRVGVVGVQPLREQAIDAMHGVGLRVRADLQNLVVVDGLIHCDAAAFRARAGRP